MFVRTIVCHSKEIIVLHKNHHRWFSLGGVLLSLDLHNNRRSFVYRTFHLEHTYLQDSWNTRVGNFVSLLRYMRIHEYENFISKRNVTLPFPETQLHFRDKY